MPFSQRVVGPLTRVLLVEDDPHDQTLFCLAARRTCLNWSIQSTRDGAEALAYLEGKPPFSGQDSYPLLHVVVLDLALPVLDGLEVLQWVRQSPEFRVLPVVVLSGCILPQWQSQAMALGAQRCFEKPSCFDKLITIVQEIWQVAHERHPALRVNPRPLAALPPGAQPGLDQTLGTSKYA